MTSLVQVTRGGCIASDGRALGMIVTVAMGIALVLSPANFPCALSPVHLSAITPLCPSHGPDAGQARCPLTHPGTSLVRGLACTDQRGDTAYGHARPVPRLSGADDVDGHGVGRWA